MRKQMQTRWTIVIILIATFLTGCNLNSQNTAEDDDTSYYVVNFETFEGTDIDSINLPIGDKIDELPSPEKEGYNFLYWSINSDINEELMFPLEVKSDTTFFAVYEKITYHIDINFNKSMGQVTDENMITVNYGESLTLTATANSGELFAGWKLDNAIYSFNPTLSFTPNDDGTLEAVFIEDTYDGFTPITDKESLAIVNTYLMGKYILTNDIDLLDTNWVSLGNDISSPFTGTFDGNNKTISNLKIDVVDQNTVGLFGVIENATIKNLNIEKIDLDILFNASGDLVVGGLTGYSLYSVIDSVNISGDIDVTVDRTFELSYNEIGGLIGVNTGTVYECSSSVNLNISNLFEGGLSVGGLIGYSYLDLEEYLSEQEINEWLSNPTNIFQGAIINCNSTGNIDAYNKIHSTSNWQSMDLGGLIGATRQRIITPEGILYAPVLNSYASNMIDIEGSSFTAGGFIGSSNTQNINCYSDSTINQNLPLEKSIVGGMYGLYREGYFNYFYGYINAVDTDDTVKTYAFSNFYEGVKNHDVVAVIDHSDFIHYQAVRYNDNFLYLDRNDFDIRKIQNLMYFDYQFQTYSSNENLHSNPLAVWVFDTDLICFYWEMLDYEKISLNDYLASLEKVKIESVNIEYKDIAFSVYASEYDPTTIILTEDNRLIFNGSIYQDNEQSRNLEFITEDITGKLRLVDEEFITFISERYILTSLGNVFLWGDPNQLYESPTEFLYGYPIEITEYFSFDYNEFVIKAHKPLYEEYGYFFTNKNRLLAIDNETLVVTDLTDDIGLGLDEVFQQIYCYGQSIFIATNQRFIKITVAKDTADFSSEFTNLPENLEVVSRNYYFLLSDSGVLISIRNGNQLNVSNQLNDDEYLISLKSDLALSNQGRLFEIDWQGNLTPIPLEGILGSVVSINHYYPNIFVAQTEDGNLWTYDYDTRQGDLSGGTWILYTTLRDIDEIKIVD